MAYKIIQKKEPAKETAGIETALRYPALATKAVAGQLAGAFGDIGKGVNELIAAPITKHIFGQEPVPYEETLIGKALPTSAQHKKTIEEHFPSLKPKNKMEQVSENLVEDTASLFLPGKYFKMGKYALSPMRSLGFAAAANTSGLGTEVWTGDQGKGDNVRRGTMMALALMNPTRAKDISKSLYQSAEKALPQESTVNASDLMNSLNKLESKILKGRPAKNVAASEKFVLDEINKFKDLDKNGKINMHSLVAQKRSLSEELQNNLFSLTDRQSKARAKELAQSITHSVKNTMKDYGKSNPEWLKYMESADKAHGAIMQSNYLSRVLQKFMKGRPEYMAHIFGAGLPIGASFISGPLAGLSSAAYIGTKLGHRIVKSPELRKHYAKVLGAAAADNPKLIEKRLDDFQEELEREERTSKSKFKRIPSP